MHHLPWAAPQAPIRAQSIDQVIRLPEVPANMDAFTPPRWPLHAGFAEALRLLPLLPFLDAIRRNIIDMMYLSDAGLSVKDIAIAIPDFGLSTVVLLTGLAMFFLRWKTVTAAGLLFAGILLQFTAELKENHKPEYPFWDYLTLLTLVVGSVCIASSLLTYKTDRNIKIAQWGLVALVLAVMLLFIGHEEHYYLAWHVPLYLTLLSFAHLASVPQWVAYDSEMKSISINARRQRGRVLMMCLSLLLIPSGLLFFLSEDSLPTEISCYRVLPLLLLPLGAIYYRHLPTTCMLGFFGWTADLLSRSMNQTLTMQAASEDVALMSAFLIGLDYSVQAEALLPHQDLQHLAGSRSTGKTQLLL